LAGPERRSHRVQRRNWLAIGLPIAAFAAYFFGLARSTDPYSHRLADHFVIGLCYVALAALLHSATLVATSLARPLGWLAALGGGGVLAWAFREETFIPRPLPTFALVVLVVGVAYAVAAGWLVRWSDRRSALATLAVAAPGLLAAVVLAFNFSTSSRWHLLRHNPLIGTPAYYALARPIADVYDTLWERAVPAPADGPVREAPPPEKHSLVFVLIDTWRADALSVYSAQARQMPKLDAYAEECVVFDDVQANSSWTRASVGSFFSGLRPEEHGAIDRGFRLLAHSTTLAEIFEARGYETAAFVTNYANVGIDASFDQGFAHFEELSSPVTAYARAEDVNGSVLSYLAERRERGDTHRPLFLYVHYLDPHGPYLSGLDVDPSETRGRVDVVKRAYDAELRYTDFHVSALLRDLHSRLDPDTIFFVTSDHGEEFGEHGLVGHGHALHRELTHVPGLLCAKALGARRVPGRLEARDFHDLLPRLAAGESLALGEWVDERIRARRDRRYSSVYVTTKTAALHRPEQQRVVLRGLDTGDWKLLWSGYGYTYELYEAASDPGEMHNRAGELPERVSDLAAEMDTVVPRWRQPQPDFESDHTLEQLRRLGYVE
jgi:arylsulfatase A-like enzyme